MLSGDLIVWRRRDKQPASDGVDVDTITTENSLLAHGENCWKDLKI